MSRLAEDAGPSAAGARRSGSWWRSPRRAPRRCTSWCRYCRSSPPISASRAARYSWRLRSTVRHCRRPIAVRLGLRQVWPAADPAGLPWSLFRGERGCRLGGGIATSLIAQIGQAVGGRGGLVLGRAIVRDKAADGQAASCLALLTMVQSSHRVSARRSAGFSARGSAGARSLSRWWRSASSRCAACDRHCRRRPHRAVSRPRAACSAAI